VNFLREPHADRTDACVSVYSSPSSPQAIKRVSRLARAGAKEAPVLGQQAGPRPEDEAVTGNDKKGATRRIFESAQNTGNQRNAIALSAL
jgi:hypothetical protein